MTNVDQVFASLSAARVRFGKRQRKVEQLLAIREGRWDEVAPGLFPEDIPEPMIANFIDVARSEERRVGKECRSRWSPYH